MNDRIDGPSGLPLISRGQLRSARQLLQRKHRQSRGEFLVEGTQAIREVLRYDHGSVRLLIVADPTQHGELLELAADRVPVVQIGASEVPQLADTVTSQGIFAVVAERRFAINELPCHPDLLVICAQVRDPGNAGTVIRCADAFGADAVILSHGSVDYTNPKTLRASVGSVFHVPIASGGDFVEAVSWARENGLQVLAADAHGVPLDEMAADGGLARPTAWVLGNEAWGLPEDVLAQVDKVVSIPMYGLAESLNLSTAAAVCLYATATAQRR